MVFYSRRCRFGFPRHFFPMRSGGLRIFLLLDQVDLVVHFANSALKKHKATLETDVLFGKAHSLFSCITFSQYKSQAACCGERLRVIVSDKTAILSRERALNCTNTLCFDEVSKFFFYGAILGLSKSY